MKNKLILEEPVDEVVKTILKEDTDSEEPIITTEAPEVPKTEQAFGIASLLNFAIIDEFEAIDAYNSQIATIKDLISKEKDVAVIASYEDIIDILTDIVNEENIHVGQLQRALGIVSPNANLIKDGESEADDTIENQ